MGWRWIETYIWAKPNSIRALRTAHQGLFEYVYAFARGARPYFDPDSSGRRDTEAGFGRDRTKTYAHGARTRATS